MAYAVIDLETTGFSPARGDRIIELAVVLVDDDGRRLPNTGVKTSRHHNPLRHPPDAVKQRHKTVLLCQRYHSNR